MKKSRYQNQKKNNCLISERIEFRNGKYLTKVLYEQI
jgi:hypothetical protein